MNPLLWFPIVMVASAAAAAIPGTAAGTFGAVGVVANHELYGEPLVGGGAHMKFPIGKAGLHARLGVTHVAGDASRFGIPCGGFVVGPCPAENLRDRGQITLVSAGLGSEVYSAPRFALTLATELQGGRASADSYRSSGEHALAGHGIVLGADASLEAAWFPFARRPFAVEVGVGAGVLSSPAPRSFDGYEPFQDGFGTRSVRVGVSWNARKSK